MNKKGVSLLLKFIIGLVIAIIMIWLLLTIVDKFLLFGKEKTSSQQRFFDELNKKINDLTINGETTQIINLEKNGLLIAFNNEDVRVDLKDLERYLGFKTDVNVMITKPQQCTNCLCLCNTKKKIPFEDDCLQIDDQCVEYKEKITNKGNSFFLFSEGKELTIKRSIDSISIEYE